MSLPANAIWHNGAWYNADGSPVNQLISALAPAVLDGTNYPPIYPGLGVITGLVADYNGDSLGAVDAVAIAAWTDDTGSGNTLTQVTGANQPIVKLKQLAGHAVARFSTGNMYLGNALTQTSYTIVVVGRFGGAINKFMLETGSNSGSVLSGNQNQLRSNATDMAAVAAGSWAIYSIVFAAGAGTGAMYRNGTFIGTVAALSAGMTRLTLGANTQSSPTFFFDGDIGRCLVFNRVLTNDELFGVNRDLGAMYGIGVKSSGSSPNQGRTRAQLTMADGNKATIMVPESYVPGNPTPLLLVSHGNGASDTCITLSGGPMAITDMALSLGMIVAASDGGGTAVIGNSVQRAADLVLLKYLQATYSIGKIILGAQSAGGQATLKHILIDGMSNVVGWIGWYTSWSLANAADTWATGAGLIGTAYGVVSPYTSSAANFPAVQAVEGPEVYPLPAFRSLGFRIYASAGDTTMNKAANADAMATRLGASPLVREINVVTCTGNHGDPSHFQPYDTMQFIIRRLSDPLSSGN